MFESTIARFDEYYRLLDSKSAPGFNRELGCEVRERLQQLDYIIERVRELEKIAEQALNRAGDAGIAHYEDLKNRGVPFDSVPLPSSTTITKEEFDTHRRASFEIKLLTEAFYYFAGRVRTILRNKQVFLPGLESFECVGVRNVRNKLLEHAEGSDSQVSIQSFGWGSAHGPVLKAVRYGGQEDIFPDGGLYRNAEEFRDTLERLLQKKSRRDSSLNSRGSQQRERPA